METLTRLARRILPWVCFAIGAGLAYLGHQELSSVSRTEGWAQAQGRVVSSSVEERRLDSGTAYIPVILYEFRIGETIRHGTRVALTPRTFSTAERARVVALRYPPGRSVAVLYNPSLPSESILERKSPAWAYGLTGLGIASVLLGIASSMFLGRKARQR